MAESEGFGAGVSLGLGAGFGAADCRNMLAHVFGAEEEVMLDFGAAEGAEVAGVAVAVESTAGAGGSVESPHPPVVVSSEGL